MPGTGHTAGPWEATRITSGDFSIRGRKDGGLSKLAIVDAYRSNGEANARLIAAAPALLEACLALVGAPPEYGQDGVATLSTAECVEMARAAIRAAQGD